MLEGEAKEPSREHIEEFSTTNTSDTKERRGKLVQKHLWPLSTKVPVHQTGVKAGKEALGVQWRVLEMRKAGTP